MNKQMYLYMLFLKSYLANPFFSSTAFPHVSLHKQWTCSLQTIKATLRQKKKKFFLRLNSTYIFAEHHLKRLLIKV